MSQHAGVEQVDHPTTTARRALEDLTAHGVLMRISQGPGKPNLWQPTDWTRRWVTVSEMSGDATPMTVPEMSGEMAATPRGVPEMSVDASTEHENGAGPPPITLPLRIDDDFSGTPPPVDEGLAEHANDDTGYAS